MFESAREDMKHGIYTDSDCECRDRLWCIGAQFNSWSSGGSYSNCDCSWVWPFCGCTRAGHSCSTVFSWFRTKAVLLEGWSLVFLRSPVMKLSSSEHQAYSSLSTLMTLSAVSYIVKAAWALRFWTTCVILIELSKCMPCTGFCQPTSDEQNCRSVINRVQVIFILAIILRSWKDHIESL